MAIRLKRVTESDYIFLYDLLSEKKPDQNISHRTMPTYAQHCVFNRKKPYQHDWIIMDGTARIGRIYVTKNDEVGIHIAEKFRGKTYGSVALRLVIKRMKRTLFANIAPKNEASQAFFTKHGFTLIQYTYRHPG